MLSILRKATESLKKSGESDLAEQYQDVEDLSVWEIVNASLSDDEDCYSLDDDEPEAKPTEEGEEEEDAGESRDLTPDDAVFTKSLSVLPPVTFHTNLTRRLVYDDDVDDDDEEEEEEDDDVYDDDDNDLVKWKVKGFGKGRMKMGKRGVRKVKKNSKRLPYYYYNRP